MAWEEISKMKVTSLKFIGYKSFTREYAFINEFSNITIFIGRNSSGKSSCIDIIENLVTPEELSKCHRIQKNLKIEIGYILTEDDIKKVFRKDYSSGVIPGYCDYTYGKKFIGKEMYLDVETEYKYYCNERICQYKYKRIQNDNELDKRLHAYWDELAIQNTTDNPKYKFRRLSAERNIVPEEESENENIEPSGTGASNLIRKFINFSEYNEGLIENNLLNALNQIIYPDSKFSSIRIQQVRQGEILKWEIFLQEGQERYALSKMGSGLKTIILVLINLMIIPETKEYKNEKIIYAFEELENNLHPALQRRLFDFLYKYSNENRVTMFLTTHSHVAINAFCNKEMAQIYHVVKKNGVSSLHKIDDYIAKSSLLDDLDVRASDLLQSNGIIWVEGPSDRVYIKRWLEIFDKDRLEEGRDYQILYYGGRLLSHYSADDEQKELMNVLITNRNAAIIMDSDKRNSHSHINDTKRRIRKEFETYNAFCWITQGKEIENYIPFVAIQKAYNKRLNRQCEQYELFPDYIKSIDPYFVKEKVLFAHKVCEYITKENSCAILDLKEQMERLIKTIKKWNPTC